MAARDASVLQLVRLRLGALAANLAGARVLMGLVVAGFPAVRATAVQLAAHPASQALHTLANMVVAGAVITLMTWLEHSTESVPGKLVAAVAAAFLLAAAGPGAG